MLVIGAGGLGSPAASTWPPQAWGPSGSSTPTVSIAPTSTARCFTLKKTSAGQDRSAKELLQALNPDVAVVEHREYLDSRNALEIIAPYDVVINGCDNFPTRYLVSDACVLLKKPLIDASILAL